MEIQLNIIIGLLAVIAFNIWLIQLDDGSEEMRTYIKGRLCLGRDIVIMLTVIIFIMVYVPGIREDIADMLGKFFNLGIVGYIGVGIVALIPIALIFYLGWMLMRLIRFIVSFRAKRETNGIVDS